MLGERTAKSILGITLFALIGSLLLSLAVQVTSAQANGQKTVPLLAVVVGFDGDVTNRVAPYNANYDWSETLFLGESSLAAYYREISQSHFSIVPANERCAFGENESPAVTNGADRRDDGVVHITLSEGYHDWSRVNEDSNVTSDFVQTTLKALDAASNFCDLENYDADGDGKLDPDELILIVCVSGYDASSFNPSTQHEVPLLWPHSGRIDEQVAIASGFEGPTPSSYIAIPESFVQEGDDITDACQEPVGIMAHELGHYLGLPDLYALNDDANDCEWGNYGVGNLSLMSKGAWARVLDDSLGWVFRATALDPWSLIQLGWCTPEIVGTSGEYHLFSRNSDAGYNVLRIPTSDPSQYYLLENREPEGCDASFKNSYAKSSSDGGIVIWRVDEDICRRFGKTNRINSIDHHPGIMPFFFEASETGAYTLELITGAPDLTEPFFSMVSIEKNLGTSSAVINLPLYGKTSEHDSPTTSKQSDITIRVLSKPGQDMAVFVSLSGKSEATDSISSQKPPATLIIAFVALCIVCIATLAMTKVQQR